MAVESRSTRHGETEHNLEQLIAYYEEAGPDFEEWSLRLQPVPA